MSTYDVARMRGDADTVFAAAVHAVDAEQCVKSFVALSGNTLSIDDQEYDLGNFDRVVAIGAGKATPRMAVALESVLGDRITTGLRLTLLELHSLERIWMTIPGVRLT